MTAPLSRVEAIARREADSTGRPHVVLNLNRSGAPLYVCRELQEGIEVDRIVSRFDPAPAATVEPAASVVGAPAPAADVTAYEVDRAEAIHGLGQKSDAELRTLADHFRKAAPLAKLASNRQSSEAIVAACERLIARRGAMVPQPCQQQQGRARVMASFRPQAWINDYAVDVDPEGPIDFDITPELLAMGPEKAGDLDSDHDSRDELRFAADAPAWIRDWSGPFEVDLSFGDIGALFDGEAA